MGSQFSQRIVDAPSPKKFSIPKFNVYNGRTDLDDHVRYYEQIMAYWYTDDAVMCIIFTGSLGNTTIRWFDKLPLGQIDSFQELAELFTTKFITSSRIVKGPEALTNLKKQKGETLREYSCRYLGTLQETKDWDMKLALNTFKYGLPRDNNGYTILWLEYIILPLINCS